MQEVSEKGAGKTEEVLKVKHLKTQFFIYDGVVKALEDVTFTLHKGEVLGLVGETGCGKSVTAFSITKLIQDPPGRVVSGEILLRNLNLLKNNEKEVSIRLNRKRPRVKRYERRIKRDELFYNQIRGKSISMIFQEPMAALNPVYTVEDQIIETVVLHSRWNLLNVSKNAHRDLDHLKKIYEDVRNTISKEESKDLLDYRDQINESFPEGLIKEELIRISNSNKGIESLSKHLELLISAGSIYGSRAEKYEMMMAKDEEINRIRDQLLLETDENKAIAMEKELVKYSKKVNLLKLSKQLKRNKKDAVIVEARREALKLLETVNIADAYGILKRYPHELSGGMLQRVVISIALANDPEILIADEPTTALDVTVQAQILGIMKQLQREKGTSILLITHDLGVIAEMCDRVAVMYAGNIAELGTADEIFHNPKHPYTIGLLSSIPRIDNPDKKLKSISGTVPNLISPPSGCRFHPRCPFAFDKCRTDVPIHVEVSPNHIVACHLFNGTEVTDY